MNKLIIVVPCYNEEEVLPTTVPALLTVLQNLITKKKIAEDSALLFVNDGSRDSTWEIIKKENEKNSHVFGLNLAGNVGHQNALCRFRTHHLRCKTVCQPSSHPRGRQNRRPRLL